MLTDPGHLVMHTSFIMVHLRPASCSEFGNEWAYLARRVGRKIHGLRREGDLGSRLVDGVQDAEQQLLLGPKEVAKVTADYIGKNVQVQRESTEAEKAYVH